MWQTVHTYFDEFAKAISMKNVFQRISITINTSIY